MERSEIVKIAGACLLPNLGGFVGSRIVKKNVNNLWYNSLNFPSFRPPSWIFGPVWTLLYSGIGYSSYLVWRDGGGFSGEAKWPLIIYLTKLLLNWAWTPIFFGLHQLKWRCVEMGSLLLAASTCGVNFYKINQIAGFIYIPYMAWLSFASLLNFSVYKLNTASKNCDPDSLAKVPIKS